MFTQPELSPIIGSNVKARLRAYDMGNTLDLEALAYGEAPVWIEHVQPVRRVEGIKIKDPVSGEWVTL